MQNKQVLSFKKRYETVKNGGFYDFYFSLVQCKLKYSCRYLFLNIGSLLKVVR